LILQTKKINESNSGLEKNDSLKSILYTNGDDLVYVVFKILEDLLSCDLSELVDDKKEDFIIRKINVSFIGEIKGVTSNVKSEHISQLDVHLQMYKDKIDEETKIENVKSLLIINHQRNKKLSSRVPVHKNQIKLSKRNNSLIIETYTLLKLYEKFIDNKVKSDTVINLFTNLNGLLIDSDL
jgi:hypothetical protein